MNLIRYRHSEFALTKTSVLIIALCGGLSPHRAQNWRSGKTARAAEHKKLGLKLLAEEG